MYHHLSVVWLLLLFGDFQRKGDFMKKKYIAILLTILSILSFVGCNKKEVDGVEVRIAEKTEAIEKKDSGEEIALLTDTFWNGVTKMVYYDFDEEIYEVSDAEKLEELQSILTKLTYKEIENPWLEGWYLFKIHTKEKIYDLSITGENINFDGKSYKVNESIAKEVVNVIMND